jgi:YkoY family integral membrane protein
MDIHALFQQITDKPLNALAIICNLILIESLLSVDNAAVVATMVLDLSKKDRNKALSYGIVGAYIFRGACLFFAAYLIQIWWLKPLGGLYLLYLFVKHFIDAARQSDKEGPVDKQQNWFYRTIVGVIGKFWATVLLVEVMDLAFSIDNVFAAVAFTSNIIMVWIGVFIGILTMRIVARGFVRLMERFPFLKNAAFIVLGVLGAKLSLSLCEHFYPGTAFGKFIASDMADWGTSALTIIIFLVPLLTSLLFNFPARQVVSEEEQL